MLSSCVELLNRKVNHDGYMPENSVFDVRRRVTISAPRFHFLFDSIILGDMRI